MRSLFCSCVMASMVLVTACRKVDDGRIEQSGLDSVTHAA
jgi:hypothetical protein